MQYNARWLPYSQPGEQARRPLPKVCKPPSVRRHVHATGREDAPPTTCTDLSQCSQPMLPSAGRNRCSKMQRCRLWVLDTGVLDTGCSTCGDAHGDAHSDAPQIGRSAW